MSEQAKFTPGPWKALSGGPYVVKSNSDPNGSCGDSVVCVTANTASHVRFAADVGSLEDKANARLIAAAPELLSALQAASAQLDSACRDFAALVETSEACMSTNALRARQGSLLAKFAAVNCERAAQKAQAVISKATGT